MARSARPGAREALLDAARAEFTLHGLERARVEDVARRAGLSKGAFYLHFETKEQAFEELLHRFFGAMEEQVRRREEAEARLASEHSGRRGRGRVLPPRQLDLECAADAATLETLWRNRQLLAVADAAGQRYAGLVDEFRRRIRAVAVARIAERQANGLVRADVDPEVVGDILAGTYEGVTRRMLHLKERPDLVAWTRSFLRVVYEGILLGAVGPVRRPRSAPPARAPRRRREAAR